MTVEELRHLYKNNQLLEAIIESSPSDPHVWIVEFRDYHGELVLLTDCQGRQQDYHDQDRASELALYIGFDQVRIENQ